MRWLQILSVAAMPVLAQEYDRPLLPKLDPSQVQQLRRDALVPVIKNKLSPSPLESGVLVSFEGGNVGESIAQVLQQLANGTALPDERYTVQPGDTLCGLLDHRGYPPPCPPLLKIIDLLNPGLGLSTRALQAGEVIRLPVLELRSAVAIKPVPGGTQNKDGVCTPPPSSSGQLKNWSRLEPRFVDCIPGSGSTEQGVSFMQYRAYQLLIPTSDDDISHFLLDDLKSSKNANVRFDLIPHNLPGGKLNQLVDLESLSDACANGLTNDPPFDYRELFDYDRDALPAVREALAPGGVARQPKTVPVHLIDTDIARAPNLFPAYGEMAPTTPWTCHWKHPFHNRYHGTHLASLIASQDNGYGFRSVASNAVIFPYVWNVVNDNGNVTAISKSRHIKLQQEINANADVPPGTSRPLYVAATSFDLIKLKPSGDQLDNKELRWEESLSKAIQYSPSLFIFSAGQIDDKKTESPVELSTTSILTPQNLGDLPNVIVVTACTDCKRDLTNLMPEAHFGGGSHPIVHVAAPGGKPILGWVTAEDIGAGRGTSQATALVAGVAAAMFGAWPESYSYPSAVKSRLQVTSRPVPSNSDGSTNPAAGKIAAGVVDPILALLDPSRHWLKQGGNWKAVKIRELMPTQIRFQDDNGAQDEVSARTLRRIVSMPDGTQAAYTNDAIQNNMPLGTVRRIGPTHVTDGTLVLCDNPSPLPLSLLQDLIISLRGVRPNECL